MNIHILVHIKVAPQSGFPGRDAHSRFSQIHDALAAHMKSQLSDQAQLDGLFYGTHHGLFAALQQIQPFPPEITLRVYSLQPPEQQLAMPDGGKFPDDCILLRQRPNQ